MNSSRRALFVMGCALSLLVMPAFAADNVIRAGADLWYTDASRTFIQFAQSPIPAGFFCNESRAFSGLVRLKGVPLGTSPEGAFRGADTIFQRLDDAVFDADGRAHTRIQFMAVSLVSAEPIKTACGPYNLSVSLAGEQPVSPHMTIVQTDENGGYFVTEFLANFTLTFTPAKGLGDLAPKKTLVMPWTETMRGTHTWAYQRSPAGTEYDGSVEIDTNGDRVPDTLVPGTTSNFAVGRSSEGSGIFSTKALQLSGGHAVCADPC